MQALWSTGGGLFAEDGRQECMGGVSDTGLLKVRLHLEVVPRATVRRPAPPARPPPSSPRAAAAGTAAWSDTTGSFPPPVPSANRARNSVASTPAGPAPPRRAPPPCPR